jgi:hypothetical protein
MMMIPTNETKIITARTSTTAPASEDNPNVELLIAVPLLPVVGVGTYPPPVENPDPGLMVVPPGMMVVAPGMVVVTVLRTPLTAHRLVRVRQVTATLTEDLSPERPLSRAGHTVEGADRIARSAPSSLGR